MKVTNKKYSNLILALEDDRGDNFIVDFMISSVLGIVPSFFYYKNVAFALVMYFAVRFTYYFILEVVYGKTIGKFDTQTKVVNIQGKEPSMFQFFIRNIVRFIGLLSGVSDDEVAIHDKVSRTFVVKDVSLKRIKTKNILYQVIQISGVLFAIYSIMEGESDSFLTFFLLPILIVIMSRNIRILISKL